MKTSKDARKTVRASMGLSGRNLGAALKTAGISKYRLAKDLNISYRVVQYWATGRRPSAAMAKRVADYLGINREPDRSAAIEARLSAIEAKLGMKKK